MTVFFAECPRCGGPKSLKAQLCMYCRAESRRKEVAARLHPLVAAEADQHIVVEIVDGMADTATVHLPAARSCIGGRGGQTFLEYDFPPATWLSVCGVRGSVYIRAGLLSDAPLCLACEAAA